MITIKQSYVYVANLQWSQASVVGYTCTDIPPQLSKINTCLLTRNEQDQRVVVVRSGAGGYVKYIEGRLI